MMNIGFNNINKLINKGEGGYSQLVNYQSRCSKLIPLVLQWTFSVHYIHETDYNLWVLENCSF